MKEELDRLRLAVDEATTRAIDAAGELHDARDVEADARTKRETAERAHGAALASLQEARSALDARLGIAPRLVAAPLPVPARVGPADLSHPALPPLVQPEWEDDDDPVRG